MSATFYSFPHTPHLLWIGPGLPRDDKLIKPDELADFWAEDLVVEEKVDGANLGISLGPDARLHAQSRGNYLLPGRSHAQWNLLWPWIAEHQPALKEGLQNGLMLFGEWCYACHTVAYDSLPDWFLGFDLFETHSGRFWSSDRRNQWLHAHGIMPVPEVKRGRLHADQIPSLLGLSRIGHLPMEGIYIRRENHGYLQARAKVVSAAFKQQIEEHWSRRRVIPNCLARAHV